MSAAVTIHPSALHMVAVNVIRSVQLTLLSLAMSPGRVVPHPRVAGISLVVALLGQGPARRPSAGSEGCRVAEAGSPLRDSPLQQVSPSA